MRLSPTRGVYICWWSLSLLKVQIHPLGGTWEAEWNLPPTANVMLMQIFKHLGGTGGKTGGTDPIASPNQTSPNTELYPLKPSRGSRIHTTITCINTYVRCHPPGSGREPISGPGRGSSSCQTSFSGNHVQAFPPKVP